MRNDAMFERPFGCAPKADLGIFVEKVPYPQQTSSEKEVSSYAISDVSEDVI